MQLTVESRELKQLEELVSKLVKVAPKLQDDTKSLFGRESKVLSEKEQLLRNIDVLERALEQLRIRHRNIDNHIRYEDFVDGELFVDERRIHFKWSESRSRSGRRKGTSPMSLQPKLLTFLLLNHGTTWKVYDIIEDFIDKVWDSLHTMDFERTQTGVVRCFTNTRFAALRLRDYGLLRFTRKEAYKTWTLSLPGFVAASRLVESRGWGIKENYRPNGNAVHPDIVQALCTVSDYETLVAQLKRVCTDDVDIFLSFEPVLKKAHELLVSYNNSLKDRYLTKAEKMDATEYYVKALDNLEGMGEFYKEFSALLNVEHLIQHFG